MKTYKKIKIIKEGNRSKFFEKIFCHWVKQKRYSPGKLICFWCGKSMELIEYRKNPKMFAVTRGGEVFENPIYGHQNFNKLYQDAYNVELCLACFYNLDIYNKTGLWHEEIGFDNEK